MVEVNRTTIDKESFTYKNRRNEVIFISALRGVTRESAEVTKATKDRNSKICLICKKRFIERKISGYSAEKACQQIFENENDYTERYKRYEQVRLTGYGNCPVTFENRKRT